MKHRWHMGLGSRKGSSLVEFAVVAPVLFGLLVGTFSLGNGLSRMVQAGSLCRSANLLAARGFDLANPDNQTLLLKSARGLGMGLPGSGHAPNPTGMAVVILTKVVKVGLSTCAKGLDNWNGDPSACPNYRKYVIAGRVMIGNQTRWESATGTPVSKGNLRGDLAPRDVVSIAGNRAAGFSDDPGAPTIVKLSEDEYTYIAEVFVDAADLSIPYLIQMDTIRVRNVS